MNELIDRTIFVYDTQGYVVPPDVMIGYNEKNWIALITGSDKKFKWARKFIPKHTPLPNSVPKYHQASFVIGHVYEFHASFQEKSDTQMAEKKRGIPKDRHWMIDKQARRGSKYNGFWCVTGIDDTGIKVVRMNDNDMKQWFPDDIGSKGDVQSSLFDFIGD